MEVVHVMGDGRRSEHLRRQYTTCEHTTMARELTGGHDLADRQTRFLGCPPSVTFGHQSFILGLRLPEYTWWCVAAGMGVGL